MVAGIMAAFLLSFPTAGVSSTIGDYLIAPTIESNEVEIVEIFEDDEVDIYADCDLDFFARVVECEAGNQGETGKRYVADVILNRIDSERFPDTLYDVVYQKNQFECLIRSWFWTRKVPKINKDIIVEEMENRTRSDILFFKTEGYHEFGTPLFKYKDHYFSKY